MRPQVRHPWVLQWVLCLLEGLESCAEPEEWRQGCWCNTSAHGLTTQCPVLPYIGDNSVASLCLALPRLGMNLLLVRSTAHQSWQRSLHRQESCSHHTSFHPGSPDQITHVHMSIDLLRHRNRPPWSSSFCAEHNQMKQRKLCYWSTESLQPGKKTTLQK